MENGRFAVKTHQMFDVHITLDKFEKGVFTLETYQLFSVHVTPEGMQHSPVILYLSLKTQSEKSHDDDDAIIYKELRFQIVFRPHVHEKTAFQNRPFSKMAAENLNTSKLKTNTSTRKSSLTLVTLPSVSISGEILAEKM